MLQEWNQKITTHQAGAGTVYPCIMIPFNQAQPWKRLKRRTVGARPGGPVVSVMSVRARSLCEETWEGGREVWRNHHSLVAVFFADVPLV